MTPTNYDNFMKYKGHVALIEYSDEDHTFVGHVLVHGKDIIAFNGDLISELE